MSINTTAQPPGATKSFRKRSPLYLAEVLALIHVVPTNLTEVISKSCPRLIRQITAAVTLGKLRKYVTNLPSSVDVTPWPGASARAWRQSDQAIGKWIDLGDDHRGVRLEAHSVAVALLTAELHHIRIDIPGGF